MLWSCSSSVAEPPPIRIGVSLPKTGTYAAFGQERLRGYKLCVKPSATRRQVLTEALKRASSLDKEKIGDAILTVDFNTVFGAFRVDAGGFQIAHKLVLLQWQDGKKVIVWPEELAPGKVRLPTPLSSQRQ